MADRKLPRIFDPRKVEDEADTEFIAKLAADEDWHYTAGPRNAAFDEVELELAGATAKFGDFNSPHEGWAIIREELDELWEEIKGGQLNKRMRSEAKQVAAMAIRFMIDCTDGERKR